MGEPRTLPTPPWKIQSGQKPPYDTTKSFSKTAEEVAAEIDRRVEDYRKIAKSGGEDGAVAADILVELQGLRAFMIKG